MGGFTAELKAATATDPGFTNIAGEVYDGPTPPTVIWDLVEEGAGCKLSKPRVPHCAPACGGGKACVGDDTCASFPKLVDLGEVKVSGFGSDITLEAVNNKYLLPGAVTLPAPPAAEGADVKVSVSGGALGALTITTKVVAPLVSTGDLTMSPDKPFALAWTAPAKADVGRIVVEVDISHHGGAKGKIDCDVPDTGTLEIPKSQVAKLIDLGVAGFPKVTLTRVATGTAAMGSGMIQFRVLSSVARDFAVAGFVSCNEQMPCPTGKTCRQDDTCTP